ncbi:aminotransferase class I/II-fold pyridoxal phosphate-dependent enzyme [uncultured Gemmiger sp.]|uniref:aminotransferase class I/II-fold pyridoxal phosphate-dependent enzyme n=1 Tax=uncultured Gemmiger sp. TaxID=1623490 RepID=UPI0025E33A07|nr:aminotransferase class I/II-fold pyridoxal phosphate-dependent enzyme [uncultured Gemmiger sp.]
MSAAPDPHILQTRLAALAAARTPLHMPGHKRRVSPAPGLPVAWDLTEIDGADDLHGAQGILAEAMARTAALWGAARTFYLVNGSTCGLLAGIRALAPAGSTVIAARNCHKAVFHAIELGDLRVRWVMPRPEGTFGIHGSVPPEEVAAALDACPQAACVILTSPTYEGVLSDIAAIAALCHARGLPLLVDEAHGAHYLPLAEPCGWVGGALAGGADVVVQSPHKTLPSLTQTALLHLGGRYGLALAGEVERQLDVFETSSPSYPLMASLDGCTGLLAAHGAEWFAAWAARLDRFDAAALGLARLRVFGHGADAALPHPACFRLDRGKILVDGARAGLTGAQLAEMLRQRYAFEPEMVCGSQLLAMTSPCDADDTLDRFAAALLQIDAASPGARPAPPLPPPAPGQTACTIARALRARAEFCPLARAEGRIAAEYLWAYPPGVPLVVPGERLSAGALAACRALEAAGTPLHHTGGSAPDRLRVLA